MSSSFFPLKRKISQIDYMFPTKYNHRPSMDFRDSLYQSLIGDKLQRIHIINIKNIKQESSML